MEHFEYFDFNILNGGIRKNVLFVNVNDLTDCILPWQALSVKEKVNNNKYNFDFATDQFEDYSLLYIFGNEAKLYSNLKLSSKNLIEFLDDIYKYEESKNDFRLGYIFENKNIKDYYNFRCRYNKNYNNFNGSELFKLDDEMIVDYYKFYIDKLQLSTKEQNNELHALIKDYNKACDEYERYKLSITQLKLDNLDNQFKTNSLEDSILYKEEN